MRFAFLFLCLTIAVPAAAPSDDVKKAEEAWLSGITTNDFPKLEKVLADDLYYLHSTGNADTKATYIESMRSGRQKYASGKINDLKIRVYGNTAVVNGDANFQFLTAGKPGSAHLKYTHVFV